MRKIGGLKCVLDIWEIAIIPSLLNNSDTWASMDEKLFSELEAIQSNFLRSILRLPKSCPLPALCYDSNSILMKFRVYRKILNFIKHIHKQNEDSLAHQVLLEQLENKWPGLYQELREGKDLQCDTDLAHYLQKVIEIRAKLRLSR